MFNIIMTHQLLSNLAMTVSGPKFLPHRGKYVETFVKKFGGTKTCGNFIITLFSGFIQLSEFNSVISVAQKFCVLEIPNLMCLLVRNCIRMMIHVRVPVMGSWEACHMTTSLIGQK
jgi:hypothetical protein